MVALNVEAQWRRLDAGQLDVNGKVLAVGPYRLHEGDVVATRHNDRTLVTDRKLMVKNRDRWTIEAIHRDGAITVDGHTGRVRLPAAYVAEHVELAYAQTCHASQGRTVDRSFLYLDAPTGAAGIYVPMTRGRESSEAFIVLRGEETPADVIAEALSRSWIDRPAVAVRAELRPAESSRDDDNRRNGPERPLGPDDLVRLRERAATLDRKISGAQAAQDVARHRVASLAREHEALRRSIDEYEARLANARRTVAELDRPLARGRHRVELERARNELDWIPRSLRREKEKLAEVEAQAPKATESLRKTEAIEKGAPAPAGRAGDRASSTRPRCPAPWRAARRHTVSRAARALRPAACRRGGAPVGRGRRPRRPAPDGVRAARQGSPRALARPPPRRRVRHQLLGDSPDRRARRSGPRSGAGGRAAA